MRAGGRSGRDLFRWLAIAPSTMSQGEPGQSRRLRCILYEAPPTIRPGPVSQCRPAGKEPPQGNERCAMSPPARATALKVDGGARKLFLIAHTPRLKRSMEGKAIAGPQSAARRVRASSCETGIAQHSR